MKDDHVAARRRFVSDAFHTLNQPLTGLHCGLEIALQKPRSEGEYRQRIGNGIEHASEILTLVRAVRQLVDAADPGERFGTVGLAIVLAQVNSELEVVAEATRVGLEMECDSTAQVKADPGKLAAVLGALIAAEMESYEPGARVAVTLQSVNKKVKLTSKGEGARKNAGNGKAAQIAEIRRNAATSYLWTIGGDVEFSPGQLKIKLSFVTS
jgi:signal transduction histidine kinase